PGPSHTPHRRRPAPRPHQRPRSSTPRRPPERTGRSADLVAAAEERVSLCRRPLVYGARQRAPRSVLPRSGSAMPSRFLRLLLVAGLGCAAAPLVLAQSLPFTGLVLDAETDEPLAGVTVLVPGTTLGTATDRDGRFHLFADAATERLTVSFVGYRTRTVSVAPGEEPVVRLEPALVDLQPVIVSASREEEARTAAPVAIAALSAADLEATKPSALHEALNRVPGVYMADLGNEQHAMSIRQPISYRALFVYLEDGIPIRPV